MVEGLYSVAEGMEEGQDLGLGEGARCRGRPEALSLVLQHSLQAAPLPPSINTKTRKKERKRGWLEGLMCTLR